MKAGVFTILKVAVYVFGPDLLAASGGGTIIAWVAGATILIGSLVAMNKDNLKARLAYSTISQLSYVVLGAVLASAWGTVGAAMHIVMHAFGKITLFFCAGAVLVAAHKTEVSELGGLGRRMPVTMGAFVVASLCIIGLPPLGGMWSKWYLATAAVDAGEWALLGVLLVSSPAEHRLSAVGAAAGIFVRVGRGDRRAGVGDRGGPDALPHRHCRHRDRLPGAVRVPGPVLRPGQPGDGGALKRSPPLAIPRPDKAAPRSRPPPPRRTAPAPPRLRR